MVPGVENQGRDPRANKGNSDRLEGEEEKALESRLDMREGFIGELFRPLLGFGV